MQGVGWFAAIVIGGFAGWIASMVMKSGTGVIVNIAMGVVGAVVLNAILFELFRVVYPSWIGQLIVGAIGAIILIFLYRLVTSRNPA